jgi:hypothetical protein
VGLGEATSSTASASAALGWLDEHGLDWIYLDELAAAVPIWQGLVEGGEARGWRRVAPPAGAPAGWALLRRSAPP